MLFKGTVDVTFNAKHARFTTVPETKLSMQEYERCCRF